MDDGITLAEYLTERHPADPDSQAEREDLALPGETPLTHAERMAEFTETMAGMGLTGEAVKMHASDWDHFWDHYHPID